MAVFENAGPKVDEFVGSGPDAHEQEVARVLYRYAWAVDSRDWDLLRSCFTDNGRLDYETSGNHESPDAFVANCRNMTRRIQSTQHFVSNVVVRVEGDAAYSRSYVFAQHTPIDGAPFFLGGVYSDEHVRGEGGWKISTRRFSVGWTGGPHIDMNSSR